MEKYLNLKNPTKEANQLKIRLYYHLGGYNCFTCQEEKRGYYISVTPVYKEGYLESYTMFTGAKQLIKAVNRKSEKARAAALDSIGEFLPGLIDYVCKQNKIEVIQDEKSIL